MNYVCWGGQANKKRRTKVIPFRNEACGEKVISSRALRGMGEDIRGGICIRVDSRRMEYITINKKNFKFPKPRKPLENTGGKPLNIVCLTTICNFELSC